VRIEHAPPKYVVIVNALRARIEDGTYPPGSMLPSETALLQEFNTSRVTVVRALELLRNDGWIDSEKGKGRFVRAATPAESRTLPAHAAALLADEIEGRVQIVDVTEMPAPNRAVAALGVALGSSVVVRRRLVGVDGVGQVELGAAYIPVKLAEGTAVRSPNPLPEGLLRHLMVRKGIHFDHVTERISARLATEQESRLLEIAPRECVLTALFTVHDRNGPVFALDVAVPPSRHEFEDSFPLTQID
jgi:GntR family transcriptional regulator